MMMITNRHHHHDNDDHDEDRHHPDEDCQYPDARIADWLWCCNRIDSEKDYYNFLLTDT